MATKQDEFDVTPEEVEQFKTAFHDPRFRELFTQYVAEITNPENRLRNEQEITEMERERGIDIQFIHPTPGHVLQTTVNGQQACYMNVCSSPLISTPRCAPGTDETGRPGQHWSLPCTLVPPREDLSSEGDKEVIFDVIFHTDTLHLASRSDRFCSMVDLTALDTVARQFNVVLDAENVKTLDEKYKGVLHAAVIRTPLPGAFPDLQDPNHPLHFPYPYNVPGEKRRNTYQHQPNSAYGECRPPNQEPTIPHYTIKHRSYVDIQDFRNDRDSAPSPVPKELVITVDLPLLSSASQFFFSIKGKDFSLESLKPAYSLQIILPYPVDGEQGNARFNTTKRQLEVIVPVVLQDPTPGATSEEDETSSTESSEEDEEESEEDEPSDSLPQDAAECPTFTCSQDATTVTLIVHVRDVDEHSISSEVDNYQCEIHFCVKVTDSPHVLFIEFLPQYNLNTEHIVVKVSEDNMVIELTKSSQCFGPWKNLFFGVNSNFLQERRFINEENVAEFLESGLRPSTIPWSTLEDQPLINLVDMTDERTHIQLNKPELEEKYYLDRREVSDKGEVSEHSSCHSDNSDLSDTSETGDMAAPCYTSLTAQTPAELLGKDVSAEEDEGLCFKEITPARELDEDDLPDAAECTHSSPPNPSSTKQVLKEVNSSDGSVHVISDHRTQCAIKFENPVLFDMD